MDYEKKYKEALELARVAAFNGHQSLMEGIFPELAESKDEKTRKRIIALVNAHGQGIYKGDMLAWLEKQGEQKPADKPKFKVKYAGNEYNVFDIKASMGIIWYGIEDEPNHIDYIKADNCEIISGYGIKESGLSIPTKPVTFSEKKPQRMISAEAKEAMYDKPAYAWSEEDEEHIHSLLDRLEGMCKKDATFTATRFAVNQDIDWLKSLKEKIGG